MPLTRHGDAYFNFREEWVFVAALDIEGVHGLDNAVMAGEHVDTCLEDLRDTAEDERDRAESARQTLDELKTD